MLWMNLKDIMLSESSQIDHVSDDCIYMNGPENSKSVETENRWVVVWGWR